ncbi:mevalonate kinase family protein [Chondromyces apiculatus]|uniref:Mevalonate kinase n=1 Tax=Chondromyces apiculatus DSM 436 TaxID=1192034 RepID=A0A017T1Q8_9BACT|nr:hypothetical protein [Chondromyces apiculatus]EYF02785.1 Mevalonate kinase [Chondromyces apiculatus DSM 436]
MIAKAPGKLVLSGAYVVLEGAPALVAAVDRYVVADTRKPADRITEEVQAALDLGMLTRAPWFDAGALRTALPEGGSRKLGVGSSAAILVASLAAAWAEEGRALDGEALLDAALHAHRVAQGGGSGLDVAASALGGVLRCTLEMTKAARSGPGARLEAVPHALPAGTVITVLSSTSEARTSAMLAQVRAFAAEDPEGYRALMDEATHGAVAAVAAVDAAGVEALIAALAQQVKALGALGDRAGTPIVTPAVRALQPATEAEGGVVLPSGAGGGDVTILVGSAAPSAALLERARAVGLTPEPMVIGVVGAHLDV